MYRTTQGAENRRERVLGEFLYEKQLFAVIIPISDKHTKADMSIKKEHKRFVYSGRIATKKYSKSL